MDLIAPGQHQQLIENARDHSHDHAPVVRLFCPWNNSTWLLSERDPENEDLFFGLCDLGFGFPELGSVSLREIEAVTGMGDLKIERDFHFEATATLSVYTWAAQQAGQIVTDRVSLMYAYMALAAEARSSGGELRARLIYGERRNVISHRLFQALSAVR